MPARRGGPWPVRQGHGLWLVRAVADEVTASHGPHGSRSPLRSDGRPGRILATWVHKRPNPGGPQHLPGHFPANHEVT